MKKLALFPCLMFLTLSLSACDLFDNDAQKGLKHLRNTTYSGEQTTWIPHEQYVISFSNDTYTLSYHKDAVNTKEVKTPEESQEVEGTFSFEAKKTYSWVGDWNAHQSVTYYIVKISTHPQYENGAYITFQLDSKVIYMNREIPEDKNLGSGQMLVKQ